MLAPEIYIRGILVVDLIKDITSLSFGLGHENGRNAVSVPAFCFPLTLRTGVSTTPSNQRIDTSLCSNVVDSKPKIKTGSNGA